MAGEFLYTLADIAQLESGKVFQGEFMRGRRERRIAMIGRSNVGKSSLINRLLGTRLARVSNQPGKTRAIHFYYWKEAKKILTDLPGYGFARVSEDERNRWSGFIEAYLDQDQALERALVLLDGRHGPTELDQEAIRFLSLKQVPVTFVFTKSDTLKTQSERAKRKKEATEAIRHLGFDPESFMLWVSSKTGDGMNQLERLLVE